MVPLLLSTHQIDITPLTAASTSSQVVLGAEASGQGWNLAKLQRLSLLGGALSAIGASQAAGELNLPSFPMPTADSVCRPYGGLPSRIPTTYITKTTVAGSGHWDHLRELHCSRRLRLIRLCIQLRQRRRCNAMCIPSPVSSGVACNRRSCHRSRLQHSSLQCNIRRDNGYSR